MKKFLFILSAIGMVALSLLPDACKHEPLLVAGNPGDTTTTHPPPPVPVDSSDYTGTPCSSDTVYFQNTILPLLVSQCAKSGCHDAASHVEGINVTTYAGVKSHVKAGSPTQSSLYNSIIKTGNERMPPAPASAWTAAQIALLKKWIQQGALNNVCNENYGNCDTTGVTYTNFIQPLFANQCLGCHSNASSGGGLLLTNYAEAKTCAQNGRLYGSVAQASGYSAMPKGGQKMSTCYVNKVNAWIKGGMKQ
jgi:hypothetical protein